MAKTQNKLTAKEVKHLKYDQKTSNKYADGGGLYLFIHKNGSKYWRLDYRRPITKTRNTLALGVYDSVSLEQARQKRDEIKKLLAQGIDPALKRNLEKKEELLNLENTFKKFTDDWLKIRALENKVDHENIRRLNKDILPFIGNVLVCDLTVDNLEQDVINRIIERGALESARRVKSIISGILKLPLRKRIITYNPADDLTIPTPQKKSHHNAIINEKDLKELLVKIWSYSATNKRARDLTEIAMKLSAYIFQRPGEIRGLLWEHVDFEKQYLTFPASKTHQDHIVPLSRQSYDLLKQAEVLRKNSRYVFPSIKNNDQCMSEDTIRQALKKLGFHNRHTAHGFRATARTLLGEEIEYRIDVIEHQLAHAVKDPNGTAYNRTKFLRRRRKMMQLWADYLDTIRQGGDLSQFKPKDEDYDSLEIR